MRNRVLLCTTFWSLTTMISSVRRAGVQSEYRPSTFITQKNNKAAVPVSASFVGVQGFLLSIKSLHYHGEKRDPAKIIITPLLLAPSCLLHLPDA